MKAYTLKPKTDIETIMSRIGSLFVALPLAPFFLLFNGGYSILGMQWIAEHTGAYGKIFWSVVTYNTVEMTIAAKAGLPLDQPIAPWLFVFGTSCMQIALFIRRLNHNNTKPLNDAVTGLLSIFDYATTVLGLMFAPFTLSLSSFIRLFWYPIAALLAIIVTFGFETMLALVFRSKRIVRPDHT